MAKRGWTRRGALAAAATGAVAACAQNVETPAYDGPVAFNHGVASGDPQANKVIIWTRVPCRTRTTWHATHTRAANPSMARTSPTSSSGSWRCTTRAPSPR